MTLWFVCVFVCVQQEKHRVDDELRQACAERDAVRKVRYCRAAPPVCCSFTHPTLFFLLFFPSCVSLLANRVIRSTHTHTHVFSQRLSELVFGAGGSDTGTSGTMPMPMTLTAATALKPTPGGSGAAASATPIGGAAPPHTSPAISSTPRRAPGPLTAAALAAARAAKLTIPGGGGGSGGGGGGTSGGHGLSTSSSVATATTSPSAPHHGGGGGGAAAAAAGIGSTAAHGAAGGDLGVNLLATSDWSLSTAAANGTGAAVPSLRDLLVSSGPGDYTELNRKLDQEQAQRLRQMSAELTPAEGDASEVNAWMGDVRSELLRLRHEAVAHTRQDGGDAGVPSGLGATAAGSASATTATANGRSALQPR